MWRDDDNKLLKLFVSMNEYGTRFPALCPLCGKESAHIYMHRHDDESHGGLWVWCSECFAYSHTSAKIPDWWNNPSSISVTNLQHSREYLNQHISTIDSWMNNMISIRDDADFMESCASCYCEKCGTLMEIKQFGPSFSIDCPKCGWGVSTSYSDPLHSDPTIYSIFLLQGNDTTVEKVKAVNQVAHINLVKARKAMETAPIKIFEGRASDILDKIMMLDAQNIKYDITPDFPFYGQTDSRETDDGFDED